VLEDRETLEQPRDLERTRQPAARSLVRAPGRDVDAVEDDAAGVGCKLACELDHQRGLTGTIGTDQGVHLAAAHLQVDAIAGDHAAEALAQLMHMKQRGRRDSVHRRSNPWRIRPASP
jgi:hypothetical protein